MIQAADSARAERPEPGERSEFVTGATIPFLADWVARHPAASDDDLAAAIEEFGRTCVTNGIAVDLASFLETVPTLPSRPVALDAAIDMTLRSLSGSSRPTAESVETLLSNYPALREPILRSARLGLALWTTGRTGLGAVEDAGAGPLPRDFGPVLESGERQFVLQSELGEGATARVFLATDRLMSDEGNEARVAIKVLKRGPGLMGAHADEAVKARRVEHPSVVRALGRGLTDDGSAYIVYEFVPGGDLSAYVAARGGKLPAREAAALCARLARGVQAAHRAGLIHCDLKPANILMSDSGDPKVADFGVSRRTGFSSIVGTEAPSRRLGTPAFMAPEQASEESGMVAAPADVYGLGGLLFWLLTGIAPNGEDADEVMRTVRGESGPPVAERLSRAGVERDLAAVCRRALDPDPARRHSSAESFAEDLEQWLALRPIGWMRPGVRRKLTLWVRRRSAVALLSVGLVLALMVGGIVAWRIYQSARDVRERERQRFLAAENGLGLIRPFYMRDPNEGYLTQQLSVLWMMEWFYGPTMMKMPAYRDRVWADRVAIALRQASYAEQRSPIPTLESMLWKVNAGFWMLGKDRWREAEPLIQQCRDFACAHLDPRDPWVGIIDGLAACAVTDRLREGDATLAVEDRPEAIAARQNLELAIESARATTDIGPLRLAFLTRLEWLTSPSALNDRIHYNEVMSLLPFAEDTMPPKPK